MANKRERHDTILEIIESRVVSSQEDLRKLLLQRGWDVTQATLSRDLRELRLARVPTPEGARYAITDGSIEESRAALDTLLPQLFLRLDGVSEMLVLRTVPGGGSTVEISVPVSLLSLSAVMAESGGLSVSLPLDAVRQTLWMAETAAKRASLGRRVAPSFARRA